MAKQSGKDPSSMSIAALGKFLDGAEVKLSALRNAANLFEADVRIYKHELSKRLGLNGSSAPAPKGGRKATKAKAAAGVDAKVKADVLKWFKAEKKNAGPKDVAAALGLENASAVRTAMNDLRDTDKALKDHKKNGPWTIMALAAD